MSWSRDDVITQVQAIIRTHLEHDVAITLDTQLVADLGIDSLGVMEVVADIEDAFNLTIADAELRHIVSFGEVVDSIVSRLSQRGGLSE
ncbi:MAG TPA: hypothetical protein ENK23_00200 [Sorangium sp.]|nr:hypothetical protein [Sorangium sp.]